MTQEEHNKALLDIVKQISDSLNEDNSGGEKGKRGRNTRSSIDKELNNLGNGKNFASKKEAKKYYEEQLKYQKQLLQLRKRGWDDTAEFTEALKRTKELREGYEKELKENKNLTEEQKKFLELKIEELKVEEKTTKVRAKNAYLQKIGDGFAQMGASVKNNLSPILDAYKKTNAAASKFANTIGLSAKGMKELQHNAITTVAKGKIGIDFNMSTDELIAAQTQYAQNFGRNISISQQGQTSLAAMTKVMGVDNAANLAAALENYGVNISESGNRIGKLFASTTSKGISFEKVSKSFLDNISMAQKYTFKDGIKGLAKMAESAAEVNFNIKNAEGFAEKLMEGGIQGSVESAAQLQILGGPFAQFADPMAMLNESMNDMEGLQKRMMNMFGSFGHLNKETGEVTVSAFDRQRIRAASKAVGMSYDDAMQYITTNARQNEVAKQLGQTGGKNNAVGFTEGFQALAKNIAVFENGKAGINTSEGFKTLDEIKGNTKLQEEIVSINASESEDIKEIAKGLRSLQEIQEGTKKQMEAIQQKLVGEPLGLGIEKLQNTIGHSNFLLGSLVVLQTGKAALNLGKGIISGGKSVAEGVAGLGRFSKIGKLGRIAKGGGMGKVASLAGDGAKLGGKVLPGLIGGLSSIPVAGWIAAGAVAAAAGTVAITKAVRNKKRKELGLEGLKGKFSVKELEAINKARVSGKVSEKLMDKLAAHGNNDLWNEINEKSGGQRIIEDSKKNNKAIRKNLPKAVINIDKAAIHIKGRANFLEEEEGRIRPRRNGTLNTDISHYTSDFGGERVKRTDADRRQERRERRREENENPLMPQINITLGGSVKLTNGSGFEADLGKALLKSPEFTKELTKIVALEMEKMNNYGVRNKRQGLY